MITADNTCDVAKKAGEKSQEELWHRASCLVYVWLMVNHISCFKVRIRLGVRDRVSVKG